MITVTLKTVMIVPNTFYKTISYSYPTGNGWTKHDITKNVNFEYNDFANRLQFSLDSNYNLATVSAISNQILVANCSFIDPEDHHTKHARDFTWSLSTRDDHWELESKEFMPYGIILVIFKVGGVYLIKSVTTYNI